MTELWREADRANAAAIRRLEQEDQRRSCLVAALARLGDIAERIQAERQRFTQMSRIDLVEVGDE